MHIDYVIVYYLFGFKRKPSEQPFYVAQCGQMEKEFRVTLVKLIFPPLGHFPILSTHVPSNAHL